MTGIEGWKDLYSMPNSLKYDDPDFRRWAFGLDSQAQKQLILELLEVGRDWGFPTDTSDPNHPLVEKLETFIGELFDANPTEDERLRNLYPTPRERGKAFRTAFGGPPVDVGGLPKTYDFKSYPS